MQRAKFTFATRSCIFMNDYETHLAGFSLGFPLFVSWHISDACFCRRQMAEHSYQELPARWDCKRGRYPPCRAHTGGIPIGNIDAVSEDGTDFIRSDDHPCLQERRVLQAL